MTHVWIPKPANGYKAEEMRASAFDDRAKPGVSKWELDTPALCVDLDKMEKNVAFMQAALKKNGVASRPHAKTHKTAAIAKYQLATGSVGICCSKLTEAEALVANGVDKILLTTSNPSRAKIRRAMDIRKAHPDFIQAVDYEPNARDLNDAAKAAGIVADVVIDIAVGTEIFSGGGSGTYNIMHLVPGFTDIQVGSYLFMDMQYLAIGSENGDAVFTDFAPSLTVMATVLNNRFPGSLTTDGWGHRRADHRVQRRLRRVRRPALRRPALEGIQDWRQTGSDRAALRPGRE